MTHTRVHGMLEFHNQVTGEYHYATVLFQADTEQPWTEVMDRAIEIAQPEQGDWLCTSDDLREEQQ